MSEHDAVLSPVGDTLAALDTAKAAYDAAAVVMARASLDYETALAAVKTARADLDAHLNARVS